MSNVPAFGDLPSFRKANVRDIVERILSDKKVFADIEPCFDNGGVCGHKVMDLKVAVDVIRAADINRELVPYNKTDFELGNVIKNALRSRYTLNKAWKIDGLNPKVAALVAFTKESPEIEE